MKVSPLAGMPADPATLVNVPKLVTAYYEDTPDASVPAQWLAFGTSGHRVRRSRIHLTNGTSLQSVRLFALQKIDGCLFLGMDTHALSVPSLGYNPRP